MRRSESERYLQISEAHLKFYSVIPTFAAGCLVFLNSKRFTTDVKQDDGVGSNQMPDWESGQKREKGKCTELQTDSAPQVRDRTHASVSFVEGKRSAQSVDCVA